MLTLKHFLGRRLRPDGSGNRGRLPYLGTPAIAVQTRRELIDTAAESVRDDGIGSPDGHTQFPTVVDHSNRSTRLVRVLDADRDLVQRRCRRVLQGQRYMVDGRS